MILFMAQKLGSVSSVVSFPELQNTYVLVVMQTHYPTLSLVIFEETKR